MYEIELSKTATKKLQRLPQNLARRIIEKLRIIAENPYGSHNNVKKLVGRTSYRLRVGDWRIIYEVEDKKLRILVLEIDTRGGIYQ
ncbi:type II toxin-antitoxin system RelE/ParE family toxin [Crocosphaera sp. XPORK-15E]|uniref:type II toxin-antitoxin system RelE family toxin n=1 Tax=Crocosphaera sp. XPORK-15E TaxID=3110247 RepID=UPI002B1F838A|nr:type II toxin-antitoxin system RelE/ParE family toxin [Crocosphaera sp. XPORK-15E]MEA5535561.1 type II toxin-antitoxin system RelE/ParE family toxin [Crocosphaera sp. XPORK-15E]